MAKTPAKTTDVNRGEKRLRESEANRAEAVEEAARLFEEQDQVEGHEGVDSSYTEPPTDPEAPIPHPAGDFYDNPENPRGIPDYMTDGFPDSQATDAQKVQNAVPKRPPLMADMDPPVTIQERVSAGQNRKPGGEVVP